MSIVSSIGTSGNINHSSLEQHLMSKIRTHRNHYRSTFERKYKELMKVSEGFLTDDRDATTYTHSTCKPIRWTIYSPASVVSIISNWFDISSVFFSLKNTTVSLNQIREFTFLSFKGGEKFVKTAVEVCPVLRTIYCICLLGRVLISEISF